MPLRSDSSCQIFLPHALDRRTVEQFSELLESILLSVEDICLMHAADATERHFPEPVGYMALSVPARQHLGYQFCLDRLQRLLSGLLTGLRPWAASRASSS